MSGSTLTDEDIALIKALLNRGDEQHHIASLFGENSGRISEINTGDMTKTLGKRAANIEPYVGELPPPGPYHLNLRSPRDIILDGLEAVEAIVADFAARQGPGSRDIQRRYHGAIAERKRELWKGRQT